MQKKQTILPLLLIGGGAFLIFAVLIWQLVAPSAELPRDITPNIPYPTVQRVSLNDAKAALDRKEAVFVDVRDLDVYQSNHIAGSINIPLGDFETRYRELNPNQWIILYCT
jgi:3-mercaptopyruvate sulfurtransferase SseA